jgi:hypothetical protein
MDFPIPREAFHFTIALEHVPIRKALFLAAKAAAAKRDYSGAGMASGFPFSST